MPLPENPFPYDVLIHYDILLMSCPYHLVCLYPLFSHSDVYPKYCSSELKIGNGQVMTIELLFWDCMPIIIIINIMTL